MNTTLDRQDVQVRRVEVAGPPKARNVAPRTPARRPSIGQRLQRFWRSPKGTLTLVFLPLLLVGGASIGWKVALPHVLAALAGTCLFDLVLNYVKRRSLAVPSSAFLSGLIVAFVLGPLEPHWVTFAVGALATLSKHVLRTRQGHLFNPAALALLVSVPLFGTGQSWWGALANVPSPWLLLLLVGGVLILDRLNKFPLALSFLGFYFGLFAFGALLDPARVAEMFRVPFTNAALFLACFMLTDPPTSPGRRSDQVWIGGIVAVVSAVAQLIGVGQAYLLVGLLAGNLTLAGRRWATQRSARSVPASRTRQGQRAGSAPLPSESA
jgi:Na+-translocating ferredoxin:NAD+ oxidoreductase RnfD subunit